MPHFKYVVRDCDGYIVCAGTAKNQVTNAALEALISRSFNSAVEGTNQGTPWKVGGISAAGFSSRSRSDTIGSHPGWVALDADLADFSFDTSGWSADTDPLGFGGLGDQLVLSDGDICAGFFMVNNSSSLLWSTAELNSPIVAAGTTFVDVYYFINDGSYEE